MSPPALVLHCARSQLHICRVVVDFAIEYCARRRELYRCLTFFSSQMYLHRLCFGKCEQCPESQLEQVVGIWQEFVDLNFGEEAGFVVNRFVEARWADLHLRVKLGR